MKKNYMNIKNILCIIGLIYLFIMHLSVLGLAADINTVIVGDDPTIEDLRNFDGEWLDEELTTNDWTDIDESLDDIYGDLYDNWDDNKANEHLYDNTQDTYYNPDCLRKYTDNDFVDIVQIRVEDLHKDTAKMVVEVNDDADSCDKIWVLYLWSDCAGDDSDDLVMFGMFIPGGLNTDDITFYSWEQGSDSGNGTLDFEDSGRSIEMDFDSENWDKVKHCNIKAIMATPDKEEYDNIEEVNMVIDIFPGVERNDLQDWWFWLLILVIIIIVAICVGYLYWRRRRKRSEIQHAKNKTNIGGK